MSVELGAKRLGLLYELIPRGLRIVALINPNSAIAEPLIREAQAGASTIGWQVEVVYASTNRDIDAAFASWRKSGLAQFLLALTSFSPAAECSSPPWRRTIEIPAIYSYRAFAEVGGLMSYGPSLPDQYRQLGIYTSRILKGEKASEMSVMQPTKFELVINLTTAKTLGLTVPATLLAIADEVIE